jgi:hypothetical protein
MLVCCYCYCYSYYCWCSCCCSNWQLNLARTVIYQDLRMFNNVGRCVLLRLRSNLHLGLPVRLPDGRVANSSAGRCPSRAKCTTQLPVTLFPAQDVSWHIKATEQFLCTPPLPHVKSAVLLALQPLHCFCRIDDAAFYVSTYNRPDTAMQGQRQHTQPAPGAATAQQCSSTKISRPAAES